MERQWDRLELKLSFSLSPALRDPVFMVLLEKALFFGETVGLSGP